MKASPPPVPHAVKVLLGEERRRRRRVCNEGGGGFAVKESCALCFATTSKRHAYRRKTQIESLKPNVWRIP